MTSLALFNIRLLFSVACLLVSMTAIALDRLSYNDMLQLTHMQRERPYIAQCIALSERGNSQALIKLQQILAWQEFTNRKTDNLIYQDVLQLLKSGTKGEKDIPQQHLDEFLAVEKAYLEENLRVVIPGLQALTWCRLKSAEKK